MNFEKWQADRAKDGTIVVEGRRFFSLGRLYGAKCTCGTDVTCYEPSSGRPIVIAATTIVNG